MLIHRSRVICMNLRRNESCCAQLKSPALMDGRRPGAGMAAVAHGSAVFHLAVQQVSAAHTLAVDHDDGIIRPDYNAHRLATAALERRHGSVVGWLGSVGFRGPVSEVDFPFLPRGGDESLALRAIIAFLLGLFLRLLLIGQID